MDAVDLREAIGPSAGRLTREAHDARIKFIFDRIPETICPSSGILSGKFPGQTAVIVGGGPSLDATLPDLRAQAERGDLIFAPNCSHDWLIGNGILPTFGVMADPAPHVVDYQTPTPGVQYLFAATLDYRIFSKFLRAGSRIYLWVPTFEQDLSDHAQLREMFPTRDLHFLTGASTVGLRIVGAIASMGCETVDLYGFDSCYVPHTDTLYAYDKPVVTTELAEPIVVSRTTGDQFKCRTNYHMAKQAMEFAGFIHRLSSLVIDGKMGSLKVRVHGDGLIPWLAWKDGGDLISHANPEMMQAKYGNAKYWDYHEDKEAAEPFYVAPSPFDGPAIPITH